MDGVAIWEEDTVADAMAVNSPASGLGLSAPAAGPQMVMGSYPNPFNQTTTIRYQLAQDGPISMEVYDVSGRSLDVLASSWQNAVQYEPSQNGSR